MNVIYILKSWFVNVFIHFSLTRVNFGLVEFNSSWSSQARVGWIILGLVRLDSLRWFFKTFFEYQNQ